MANDRKLKAVAHNKELQIQPVDTQSQSSKETPVPMLALGLEEEIRTRAYDLYEQRGRQDGNDLEDWVQAETEILARQAQRNIRNAA